MQISEFLLMLSLFTLHSEGAGALAGMLLWKVVPSFQPSKYLRLFSCSGQLLPSLEALKLKID